MKTLGSICAGIGGFDLAFQAACYETKWYSEIEPQCCKLLAEKFPDAKSYGDLTQFKPDPIADAVDAVCGGTPCQDLSVAGLRAGLGGKRSGLFYQMVRVCKRLRPRHIVWENVPGAFSSNGGRDFAAVLRAFTGLAVEVPVEGWGNAGFVRTPFPACRWHVAWRVLDAQYFGLAQRRERVFLVGSLGDASCLEILFEPESVRGDSAPGREAGQRTAGTISARTEGGGGLGTDFEIGGGLSKTLKAAGNCKHREDSETYIPVRQTSFGGGYVQDDQASTLKSRDSKDATDLIITHALRGEGFDASEDGTGRGTPIIAFQHNLGTLTNPGSGGRTHSRQIAHETGVRRLTPTECERLQGFPDGWTKGFSDSARYRMLGNAVAKPVSEWMARRIAKQ